MRRGPFDGGDPLVYDPPLLGGIQEDQLQMQAMENLVEAKNKSQQVPARGRDDGVRLHLQQLPA